MKPARMNESKGLVAGFVRLGYPLHFVTLGEQDALASAVT
jgi:hypothetical protein